MLKITIPNNELGKWELVEYMHVFSEVQKWTPDLYERAFLDIVLPKISEAVHNFKYYTDGLIDVTIEDEIKGDDS